MIGAVFALGALGNDDGLYAAAFRRLTSELSQERSTEAGGRVVDILDRFGAAAVSLVERHFAPYDDVAETLSHLRELQIPCAILSDGWSGVDRRKAEAVRFHGRILFGEDLPGGTGRSVSAFAALAAAMGLPADRLWFVGADPRRDIAPARAAGLCTVWLNRSAESYPRDVAPPDHTIARLQQFLDLLSGPYTQWALALREIFG
jgi:putative hydrolase of the HAD superfamily